jgi:hypothetical protein
MRFRIWSELVPADVLDAPATLALLAKYKVDPILAVRPGEEARIACVMERMAGEGLRPSLWPMIADEDGRWASARTHEKFMAFARLALDEALSHGPVVEELVVDLEPPFEHVKGLVALEHRLPVFDDAPAMVAARYSFDALGAYASARGVKLACAIVPTLVFDEDADLTWENALGTPLSGVGWSAVSPMIYTSMMEGYTRGLLGRADVLALLSAMSARTVQRFGDRASVSLGVVDVGALGDEPRYRSPSELAEDVAIALASGPKEVVLFDLSGVLKRAPSEAWLEALTNTPAVAGTSPSTWRARAALGALRIGKIGLGLFTARRRAW